MITLSGSVSGVWEVVAAFVWGEAIERGCDGLAGCFDRAGGGVSKKMFELGEDLFDGIEIGTVRGQKKKPCSGVSNGGADGFAFVRAEIVENDDIARF